MSLITSHCTISYYDWRHSFQQTQRLPGWKM